TRPGRNEGEGRTRNGTTRHQRMIPGAMMDSPLNWVDPRPRPSERALAPRKPASVSRRLVFFDNSKLSPPYDRWMPLVPPILSAMQGLGSMQKEYADLLMEPVARHAERVATWKEEGVDGIFFGLCDAGVVQPTLLLAA